MTTVGSLTCDFVQDDSSSTSLSHQKAVVFGELFTPKSIDQWLYLWKISSEREKEQTGCMNE